MYIIIYIIYKGYERRLGGDWEPVGSGGMPFACHLVLFKRVLAYEREAGSNGGTPSIWGDSSRGLEYGYASLKPN